MKPLIGLITQIQEAACERDPFAVATNPRYLRAIAETGATPRRIPLPHADEAALRSLYDPLDALLLTGGADIDPVHYGAERHPRCERSDPARDRTELLLCRWALADGKPVLGVCRGMQLLNVAAGGTLYQDLASERPASIKHDYLSTAGDYAHDLMVHEVRLAPASGLDRVLGRERVLVNSMHHQAIRRLAPGLAATAHAPDGLIEGVEGAGAPFVIGVQWHPEELTEKSPVMRRLFRAFVEAAARFPRESA